MRYLSLFSGIEACTVAWQPLGWECVGFSEIEPFPCQLLATHYPSVPNLGDITKITKQQIIDLGDFDVLVFGSPCQNLSVSGNRKGLTGEASGLFYEALRIFNYARKYNKCRFALWENVTGAFSSNKGNDFTQVVREMAGLPDVTTPQNGWGNSGVALGDNGLLEWRVLDAQYFGLAQRRKRVFAILDTGDWQSRRPILFERESLRGDTPPSREAGGENTRPPKECPTKCNKEALVVHGSQHPISSLELALPLGTNGGKENVVAYTIHADPTPKISYQLSGTLRSQGGGGIVPPSLVYGFDSKQSPTSQYELSGTLVASGYKEPVGVIHDCVVRRLTPIECERLMGFPDDYTNITFNNKPASNSVRYKALGNSMAVPVMGYIAKQLQLALDED